MGRKKMRERHGIPDATQIRLIEQDWTQSVSVTDGQDGEVRLSLGTSTYPAGLTPQQARFIAALLVASAERVAGKEEKV